MNVVALTLLALAATSAVLGLFALRMSRAPGWSELRPFALVALSSAGLSCCDTFLVVGGSPEALARAGAMTISFGGLHVLGWVLFLVMLERRRPVVTDWVLMGLASSTFVAGLIPGLTVSPADVTSHTVGFLDLVWHDTPPTAVGTFFYFFFLISILVHTGRLIARYRRGVAGMGTFILGFLFMWLTCANDVVVSMGYLKGPYLLDVGLSGLVAAASVVIFRRFVASARELGELTSKLERTVESRTKELSSANEAILRAEKLGSIGALSAGVAHEINNPAAVVLSNLEFLAEESALPTPNLPEMKDSLRDAVESTQRIARIVRQLLDAGRVASGRHGLVTPFIVDDEVQGVLQKTPAAVGVRLVAEVPRDLVAEGSPSLFRQALAHVVANGVRAIEERGGGGQVTVRASRAGDSVVLEVADTGGGIPPETRARLFEPFSTARIGKGAGLGLAVSLGLMRAQGGDIALVSTSWQGTSMRLTLPLAEREPGEVGAQTSHSASELRLLLVEGDAVRRRRCREALTPYFLLESVDDVRLMLRRTRRSPEGIDVVLLGESVSDDDALAALDGLTMLMPTLAGRVLVVGPGRSPALSKRLGGEPPRLLTDATNGARVHELAQQLTRLVMSSRSVVTTPPVPAKAAQPSR